MLFVDGDWEQGAKSILIYGCNHIRLFQKCVSLLARWNATHFPFHFPYCITDIEQLIFRVVRRTGRRRKTAQVVDREGLKSSGVHDAAS